MIRLTKTEFKKVAQGKSGQIAYANGNSFEGKVIIKSREMVIGGLHCRFEDIVKIEMNSCVIEFTTKNGYGCVSL